MLRATHIDLVAGPDRACRALAAALCLVVVACVYAQRTLLPGPLVAAAVAFVGYFLLLSVAGARCRFLRPAWQGRLRLGRDGSAEIGAEQGYWLTQCWTSRYLVVLRLAGFQRARTAVITRTLNHPDDYRRLLVWARFDPRQNHRAGALAGRP